MLLDELNEVKVSKGILDCLDTRHHPDDGQFLTTTDSPGSFACWNLWEGSRKSRVGGRSFNALTSS